MKTNVNDITIEWDTEKGTCTFEKLPVAMMWIDTTLRQLPIRSGGDSQTA